jgi:redox-sensitive bicupin YhaK (pirin superfamily)
MSTSNTTTHAVEPAALARPRGIDQIVAGVSTSDGDGVKLTRVLNQTLQQRLDPYLMLDATTRATTSAASRAIRTAASKQ